MPRPAPSLIPSFSRPPSRVAIRNSLTYQSDLAAVLHETLLEFDLPVRGKTVLLKPNFVGFDPLGMTNTHPVVVHAARETFLRLGASTVLIGEGPALERDTQAVLESIRLREYLGPLSRIFVDLNVDDVERVGLKTRCVSLERTLSSQDRPGHRLPRFSSEDENPPLGWGHTFAQEHVWSCARKLLWLAQKCIALGRN